MFHQSSKQIILGIFVALLLTTMPVYAVKNFKVSNYAGAHQIWFEAEDYDERNPDTDEYYLVVDSDGAFGQAMTRDVVRYQYSRWQGRYVVFLGTSTQSGQSVGFYARGGRPR
jgi:hypothetical protein